MEPYEIVFHQTAKADLDRIIAYLEKLSPSTAGKHADAIIAAIDSLAFFPNRCPPAKDAILREKGYRYLVVKTYLVFFTVSAKFVRVQRIIDGRSAFKLPPA